MSAEAARRVTITLPIPDKRIGGNDRSTHYMVRPRIRKRAKEDARLVAKSEINRLAISRPLSPVTVVYRWYFRGGRIDPDNVPSRCKAYLDGLVAAELIPNDSAKHITGFTVEIISDHGNPRVEIELTELASYRQQALA